MKIGYVLLFTAEAHEQGSVVCEQCKQNIAKTEDFVIDLPLPTVKTSEVKMLHFRNCYSRYLEANRANNSNPIELLDTLHKS